MNPNQFYNILLSKFPFEPTTNQNLFFQQMADFCTNGNEDELFVLQGYAGTGKTTVIATLVENLIQINTKYVLLAPTGRAAKVIANYAQKPAQTIHKKIYFPKKKSGGGVIFTKQINKHTNTIFIVDEASMISDSSSDGLSTTNESLLDDLMSYIYNQKNCKMILIGDQAQLPPVHATTSPALNLHNLEIQYFKEIKHIVFDEVMRQEAQSGILINATQLRYNLEQNVYNFQFQLNSFKDIIRLEDGYEIQDAIYSAYSQYSVEDTAFIVRSNKRANQYNQQIRSKILDKESQLSTGDYLMVVKNNYFWLSEKDEAGFIANGDIIEVLAIFSIQELYGFTFAKVKVRMIDYPNQPSFETILLLDTINSETPALSNEESNKLYQEVLQDYISEPQYKRYQKIKENEYFNALQVKFAYAFTCHKSQGGQWKTVFIEQPYLPDNIITVDYIRWLYTAITRAKEKLYLIGFKDDFFIS